MRNQSAKVKEEENLVKKQKIKKLSKFITRGIKLKKEMLSLLVPLIVRITIICRNRPSTSN